MVKLKKHIGKLEAGFGDIVTPKTPEATIKRILKRSPHLKVYFEGFTKPKNDDNKK